MLFEDIELEVLLEDIKLEVLLEDRSSCLEVATPAFAFPVLASSGQIDPRLVTKDDQTMYIVQWILVRLPTHFSDDQ